jgi:hypothetical protein
MTAPGNEPTYRYSDPIIDLVAHLSIDGEYN